MLLATSGVAGTKITPGPGPFFHLFGLLKSLITACRSLMQRALRMCAESALLWAQYFRMELLYAAKLHTRRSVLGLEAAAGMCCIPSAALFIGCDFWLASMPELEDDVQKISSLSIRRYRCRICRCLIWGSDTAAGCR